MTTLDVRELSVEVGGKTVVSDLSFTLRAGDKMGVVGRNGAGKTSLLKVLGGEDLPLTGTIERNGALGYLRQDPRQHRADDHITGLEHILAARDLVDLARRLEKARIQLEESHADKNVARFARLEEEYRELGGYAAESEARTLTAGLGLANDRLALPVRALSGGERRRLELARILFGGSDLLMLDEPTNHLDADAKHWLMKFLASYRGALIVVSHDIKLLDASITRILHVDREQVVEYRGTYSQYRKARSEDEIRLRALAGRQEQEIRRLKTLADSMRGQTAKRARKAKTLDTRVEKLAAKKVEGPAREQRVKFRFPEPPHSGKVMLVANELAKSYGGPPVFEDISFDVGRGERLLIMGLNGAGKTSLLRILAGESEGGSRDVPIGARGRARLLRAGARGRPRRRAGDRPHEGRIASRGPGSARAARHVPPLGRDGVPGRRDALGRREDQAGAGAAGRRPEEPADARRADEQPRSAVAHRDRRGARGLAGFHDPGEPRHRVRGSACAAPRPDDARRNARLLERRPPRARGARLSRSMLRRPSSGTEEPTT